MNAEQAVTRLRERLAPLPEGVVAVYLFLLRDDCRRDEIYLVV